MARKFLIFSVSNYLENYEYEVIYNGNIIELKANQSEPDVSSRFHVGEKSGVIR